MAKRVHEFVFVGTSDEFEIHVQQKDDNGVLQDVDFSAATRMVLDIAGQVIDENSGSSMIDWSAGGGRIVFRLGKVQINDSDLVAVDEAVSMLRVYDPAHPDGQTLAHSRLPSDFVISIIDDSV